MAAAPAKSVTMNLYGVQLVNKELVTSEPLQGQLVMMLEILAEYGNR